MDETRLEELLYQLMQHRKLREIADALNYRTVAEMVAALKTDAIGADDRMFLANVLNMEFSQFYNTFFA